MSALGPNRQSKDVREYLPKKKMAFIRTNFLRLFLNFVSALWERVVISR